MGAWGHLGLWDGTGGTNLSPNTSVFFSPALYLPWISREFPLSCFVSIPQGDVWICMELMDTSLDKFYKKVLEKKKTIPEDILGKMAVSVSGPWVPRWVCACPEPAGGLCCGVFTVRGCCCV